MKQLIKKIKQISVLILLISLIGCTDDDTVLPKVISGFTYTLNADTGTVTFINISENSSSYDWDFGDGGTSKEINPIKTYANGTFTVTLKASNVAGASATFEGEVTISIPNPIAFPITFDDPNVAYIVATFNGTSFEIIDNPDVSGTNDKASGVGAITNSGAVFEGVNFDLGTQIDFTTDKTITMNFWADAEVDVLMKLEQGTGPDIEVTASHGGTGWEIILFNFNSSNKYVRVTLFIDGPGTTAGTFYIDDIIQIETPPVPCTAETAQSLDAADFNLTFQTDPGASIGSFDAVLTTVSNPDSDNAVNSSCQVGQIDRSGGAEFANNQIEFDAKLDFNANAGFKMKVWSPVAGTNVLVKLEDKSNSDINVEVGATTTTASAWEELTFDFASGESGKYDKIILFFELNTNTEETYYIDDFMFYAGGGGGAVCTAETTESLSAANFNLTFMSDPTASVIEDGGDFEYVSNPDFDNAVNSSCFVGKITKLGNNPWDNNQINLDAKLDFNANAGFKIKVYSAVAGFKVRIKLEDQADANMNTELEVTSTKTSEWEELTFPFASTESDKYDKIVLFFDLDANNTDTYYFDDLTLSSGGGGSATAPTTAAPTPTAAASDVISVYSDAYTDVSGTDFNPGWGQATVYSEVQVAGNNTMLYTGLDYQGIVLGAAQDASGMEFLHIDFWTANSTALNAFLISTGPVETAKALAVPTSGWASIDIPLSDFSGVNLADVIQMKFDGDGDIYLDNIYFYKAGGGSATAPTTAAPTPTAAASDVISVYSDAYTDVSGTDFNPGWGQATVYSEVQVAGNNTMLYTGLDYQGIVLGAAQDASGMEFLHIDFWTANSTALNAFLISTGPVETAKALAVPTSGWASIDIPLSDFSGVNLADVIQMKFDGDGDIYLDNIYFYKAGGGGTGTAGNLATNGDFETGDISGWTTFVDAQGASFTATNIAASCGTYSGNLVSDFEAGNGAAVDAVVKQANIGIGTITPNTQVTISFDARGSAADGGVFFAEFFSELTGGGTSAAEILSGGPITLNDNWTHYSFTTTTGSDVSGGITLQMKTSCGPVADCVVDAYFDNVFVGIGTTGGIDGTTDCTSTGGGGTVGTGSELAINGDFETGDTSGWTTFVDATGASFTASSTEPSTGSFSGNLIADFEAGIGGAVDAVVKQANIGAGGDVTPNTEYVVSFDLRGSANDGGVFFVEFFSELSGGGTSAAEIITGGPHPLTSTWTTYSYTVITGSDVSGGITLQLKSSCGPVANCLVDVFFDNVSIKLK